MQHYLKTLFAIVSIFGAALLLFQAVRLIGKNTPSQKPVLVKTLPPTAPIASRDGDPQAQVAYIGGVGIVEPEGESTVIGSQLPGVVEKVFGRSLCKNLWPGPLTTPDSSLATNHQPLTTAVRI